VAERTDAGDARGYRIALIADELLNPAEGGIDGLAELERAGWGAIQLPAAAYLPKLLRLHAQTGRDERDSPSQQPGGRSHLV